MGWDGGSSACDGFERPPRKSAESKLQAGFLLAAPKNRAALGVFELV